MNKLAVFLGRCGVNGAYSYRLKIILLNSMAKLHFGVKHQYDTRVDKMVQLVITKRDFNARLLMI